MYVAEHNIIRMLLLHVWLAEWPAYLIPKQNKHLPALLS